MRLKNAALESLLRFWMFMYEGSILPQNNSDARVYWQCGVCLQNEAFLTSNQATQPSVKKMLNRQYFFTKENKCCIYLLDFENRATWATDAKSCHKIRIFGGKEKHVSSKKVKAPFRNSSVTFAHAQCGPYHCKPSTNMQSGNSPPTPFFSKGDTPKKNHKPHATSVAHFHHPLVKANFVSLLLGGACPPKSSFCKPPAAAPSRAFCEPPCLWAFSRKYLAPLESLSRATMKVWASFLCKSTEHSTSHWISKEVFYHLNTSHLRSEVGPGPPFPRPLQPGHWSNW